MSEICKWLKLYEVEWLNLPMGVFVATNEQLFAPANVVETL